MPDYLLHMLVNCVIQDVIIQLSSPVFELRCNNQENNANDCFSSILCWHVQNKTVPVLKKDIGDKENAAVDVDVNDPETFLDLEEQDFKTEENVVNQDNSSDAKKKVMTDDDDDDDTSDEDINNRDAPGTTQICPVGLATRIDKYISNIIIPKLHKALIQKVCNWLKSSFTICVQMCILTSS